MTNIDWLALIKDATEVGVNAFTIWSLYIKMKDHDKHDPPKLDKQRSKFRGKER